MPLTVFVAMSAGQEMTFNGNGGTLTLDMFAGPSIPMKLHWRQAVENGNASPAAPMATVISIEISEAKLAEALQQNVVQFGNWGKKPGCRWFADYTSSQDTDWQFETNPEVTTPAAHAIADSVP